MREGSGGVLVDHSRITHVVCVNISESTELGRRLRKFASQVLPELKARCHHAVEAKLLTVTCALVCANSATEFHTVQEKFVQYFTEDLSQRSLVVTGTR